MPRCQSYTGLDGSTYPLDEAMQDAIERTKDGWSAQGKRVILLARRILPQGLITSPPTSAEYEKDVMNLARSELTLVGIVGIVDPPVRREWCLALKVLIKSANNRLVTTERRNSRGGENSTESRHSYLHGTF